jgi:5-(carboxyamino)imidazole ribonucleotide mutase
MESNKSTPKVAIIMGSRTDWPTMCAAAFVLDKLGVEYETGIVSAHRTPLRMVRFACRAERRGIHVIIAGAGGAAHLPGMVSSLTTLPVLGVPVASAETPLNSEAALLSMSQMPGGVPLATFAVGKSGVESAGAKNAGLQAARILALSDPVLKLRLKAWCKAQTDSVPETVED